MAVCIPFLGVSDLEETILWYQSIGFQCTGSNRYWDPEAELSWAQLEWEGAAFMIYPSFKERSLEPRDAGLYFKVSSFTGILEKLKVSARIIEYSEDPYTESKQVVFEDLNGFRITFNSA